MVSRTCIFSLSYRKSATPIYESSPDKNRAINEIIEIYKRTFQQESVLRATSEVKVSF
ncbi:DUF3574 domain-containing protein [Microcoleus sp. A003_D6]|uniref:DUF3574 domain-containing protein n=1 Tax=Microcoleus sp. A003_D6 TaxID=3055266 RepID=UPI002FD7138A